MKIVDLVYFSGVSYMYHQYSDHDLQYGHVVDQVSLLARCMSTVTTSSVRSGSDWRTVSSSVYLEQVAIPLDTTQCGSYFLHRYCIQIL